MNPSNVSVAAASVAEDSQGWIERLQANGAERDAALVELHALLLRASRFEVNRRRASSAHLRGNDYDDLAQQSADDALVAILRKLGDFRALLVESGAADVADRVDYDEVAGALPAISAAIDACL